MNIFGPSFFLASWMTSQFFRVQKQASVEQHFKTITETIVGGDTFPVVKLIQSEPHIGAPMFPSGLLLKPQGKHSLYDLTTIVTDIEILAAGSKRMAEYQKRFQLGTLGRAYENRLYDLAPSSTGKHSFHIQSFARNGQFNQRLLVRKIGERWVEAYRITHDGKLVFEQIDKEFPADALISLDPDTPWPL